MLRNLFGTHSVIHTANDANQDFARNLTPDYSVQKSILLTKKDEKCSRMLMNAYGEMEMAKEKEMRDGKGLTSFVANSGGRGNRGGARGCRFGRGGGKRSEGRKGT